MGSPEKSIYYLYPSIITTFGMFFSFLSLIYREYILYLLIISGLCDWLDGTVARKLNAESTFGLLYDSFADSIDFGLVPTIHLAINSPYTCLLAPLYFTSCSIRLITFTFKNSYTEHCGKKYFNGLPSPISAMFVIFGICYANIYISIIITLLVTYLMNSNIKFMKPDLSYFDNNFKFSDIILLHF